MPAEHTYDYAIIRVVPRVDRGECINVGVILSCPSADFLEAQVEIDSARLLALDPSIDVDATRAHLEMFPRLCRGGGNQHGSGGGRQERRLHRPRRKSAGADFQHSEDQQGVPAWRRSGSGGAARPVAVAPEGVNGVNHAQISYQRQLQA